MNRRLVAQSLRLLGTFAAVGATSAAGNSGPGALRVSVAGLIAGGHLPVSAAYCPPKTMEPSQYDISPAVTWSPGPAGTRSYVLIMSDLDVPQDLSLINKPGVTLSADTPRMSLVHWVLVDIPATITRLPRGAEGSAFVPRGKPLGPTDHGVRGANAYTFFYPKDSALAGPRGGYDGPCPPHNDRIVHRYVTRIYALDVPSLELRGLFFAADAEKAMQGHVLATSSNQAVYP